MMGLQCVRTDTIPIIHTPAHHTGTTVRSGLTAECLSAPVRGITGVGATVDIGVVVEIGAMAATGARDGVMVMPEDTDAAMPEGTDAATPATMLAAGTDTVTQVADSMAAEQSAAADSTVGAEVVSVVAVDSTVEAEVAFTVVAASTVAVDMAADTGN